MKAGYYPTGITVPGDWYLYAVYLEHNPVQNRYVTVRAIKNEIKLSPFSPVLLVHAKDELDAFAKANLILAGRSVEG